MPVYVSTTVSEPDYSLLRSVDLWLNDTQQLVMTSMGGSYAIDTLVATPDGSTAITVTQTINSVSTVLYTGVPIALLTINERVISDNVATVVSALNDLFTTSTKPSHELLAGLSTGSLYAINLKAG